MWLLRSCSGHGRSSEFLINFVATGLSRDFGYACCGAYCVVFRRPLQMNVKG